MKIAIEGCAHGELDKIYECVEALQEKEGIKIDLLICCGDFQSVRNNDDLRALAVPEKYQDIRTFYKYYNGQKKAPVLTLFIGGNHEASNYLQELPYGGWVAPNIYYLGRAGVVKVGDLRIGGLSGIFKGRDYLQGLWECPPYNQSSLRSVYHIRALDIFRLSQLKEKVHVMLSHDWPRGITEYGDKNNLLKRKPFFREDIESNQLGSAPAEKLLHLLKPDYWFAAHLHCQFAALVPHENDEFSKETKFLALDKCLPKRRHLQILDIPPELDGDKCLKYDVEWLAVLKNTNHLLTVRNVDCHMPGPGGNERFDFTPNDEDKELIEMLLGDMTIKQDSFVMTAPAYTLNSPRGVLKEPIRNPQTVKLCETLGIDDPLQVLMARTGKTLRDPDPISNHQVISPEESKLEIATPKGNLGSLSLPAPVTPSFCESLDSITENESLCTPDNSIILDSTPSVTPQCGTPVSTGKRTFKRRNQAMYTPDDEIDESVNSSTGSIVDSGSPRSPKLTFRPKLVSPEES